MKDFWKNLFSGRRCPLCGGRVETYTYGKPKRFCTNNACTYYEK